MRLLASDESSMLYTDLAILWTLICSLFVVFMQCGFALLESGTVRSKNVKNILLKNLIDAAISVFCWWSVGYAFAYGSGGPFIGHSNFFSASASSTDGAYWARWLWGWAFSATAATVVSGAVAERSQFKAYVLYTAVISTFVYPVVCHWVWSSSGWLSARRLVSGEPGYSPTLSSSNGLMDYAGSGVVHMVGGGAALMGAWLLGPRLGRFNSDGSMTHFEPSSPTSMALGVFILWLGWYGFNAGSTGCVLGCMSVAAKVAVNTTLSVGASGLTCLVLAVLVGEAGDIAPMLNGVLAGAVSITAGCAVVTSYAAMSIGIVGGCVYSASSKLLLRLRVDDPLDVAPVHFFCGAWGLLSIGFFATESLTQSAYGYANDWGVFYGGQGYQLGVQVLGAVVIAAWTCALNGALFLLLRKCGWLRVPKEVEVQGLDFAQGLPGRNLTKYDSAVYMLHQTRLSSVSQQQERSTPRPSLQLMRTSRHAVQPPAQLPLASAEVLRRESAQRASVQKRSEKSLIPIEDSVGRSEE